MDKFEPKAGQKWLLRDGSVVDVVRAEKVRGLDYPWRVATTRVAYALTFEGGYYIHQEHASDFIGLVDPLQEGTSASSSDELPTYTFEVGGVCTFRDGSVDTLTIVDDAYNGDKGRRYFLHFNARVNSSYTPARHYYSDYVEHDNDIVRYTPPQAGKADPTVEEDPSVFIDRWLEEAAELQKRAYELSMDHPGRGELHSELIMLQKCIIDVLRSSQ